MAKLNLREMKRMYETEGADFACATIGGWVKKGQVKLHEQSLREMWEALVPNGEHLLKRMDNSSRGGMRLREASDATDTSAFANVIGQIQYTELMDSYEGPELLWPNLCESRQTKFLNFERIPGVGSLGDKSQTVLEADAYPVVGVNEQYIDRGPVTKNGFITGLTREILIADNMGLIADKLSAGSDAMKYSTEKRAIDLCTGVTNNYKRNGTTNNTYLTSGAYVNSFTGNALTDFQSLNTIFVGMSALTDPNTGEPINFEMENLIVPPALKTAAFHAQRHTSIEKVDNTANATSIRTLGPNPFEGVISNVLCSQYIKNRTSSDTTWFGGRPKRAIRRYYAWDIEADSRTGGEKDFHNDIKMEWKFSVMDMFQMMEPRYLFKAVA